MTQERATGRDVILAIGENMRQSLEPLLTKTLAPSRYQVYLHPDDHDHLRTIFGELEAEAEALLERELARLNRGEAPSLESKLLAPLRKRIKPLAPNKPPDEPPMRYVSAEGRWTVRFQEDPNGELAPGDIKVVSEFARPAAQGYGAGSLTHRISTTRRLGQMTTERESAPASQPAVPRGYARIAYQDDRGNHTFHMERDEIVIGRGAADVWVDLCLDTSLDVSREHARIQRLPAGGFRIKDLSSLGTTVDGQRLPASLEKADGAVRDLDRWVDLPDRARIGLADVVYLDFERSDRP